MYRLFIICICLVILFSCAAPALAADLDGGYYFVADSSLGSGLKFYIPSDYAEGSLTYNDSGYLFNLTSSSIYLYCPDHPNYTIYASRFSPFQYRIGSGFDYAALNLRNISDTNVEIYDSDPASLLGNSELLLLIVFLLLVFIGCYIILRR